LVRWWVEAVGGAKALNVAQCEGTLAASLLLARLLFHPEDRMPKNAKAPFVSVAVAALEALEREEARNIKLRASRLAKLDAQGLEESLWMAAGERSIRRAAALFKAGARATLAWRMSPDCSRQRAPFSDGPEALAFERAALLANFAFLQAAQNAGVDPLRGWEGIFTEGLNFGDVGHDKQARWLALACAPGLSLEGAATARLWLDQAGQERAGCSSEPGYCWDVAEALARSLEAGGALARGAAPEEDRSEALWTLREMICAWESSARARSKGSGRPRALASRVSSIPWDPGAQRAAWWARAAGGERETHSEMGPAGFLASCCAGDPPVWVEARDAPWARGLLARRHWQVQIQSAQALERDAPQRSPFALACAVWGCLDVARALAASSLRSKEAFECAAWMWAAELDANKCARLAAVGFDLTALDQEACRRGWLRLPRMTGLMDQSDPRWSVFRLEQAQALGRIDPRLWKSDGGAALALLALADPEAAAGLEKKELRKASRGARVAGGRSTRL
jgi:hypothetical protein